MGIKKIARKAKEAMQTPYEFGHGDIGDVLVSFLKGEYSENEALTEIELLRQTYEQNLENF